MCASGLAAWLLAHAASAQGLAGTVPFGDAVRWADDSMSAAPWRFDDPDLLRADVTTATSAVLAEGATVTASASVDLDDDGRDELLLQVSPRVDPAPENTASGLVLLHPFDGRWRARVLARGAPWSRDSVRDTLPAAPFAWSLVREGPRRRLVIGYVTDVFGENPSGHGHDTWAHSAALRVRLVDGEPRVDGLCTCNDYPERGSGVWRSSHVACVDEFGNPRPPSACDWSSVRGWWSEDMGSSPPWRALPDASTAAWCRAFARGPRHAL
ncbi:MAG: hypothetical protein U0324_42015 [Polyangiales bacterium]